MCVLKSRTPISKKVNHLLVEDNKKKKININKVILEKDRVNFEKKVYMQM